MPNGNISYIKFNIFLPNDISDQPEKHFESNGSVPDVKVTSSDSSDCKEAAVAPSKSDTELENEDAPVSTQNGEISESNSKNDVTSSSLSQENGEVTSKGKGKALAKTNISKTQVNVRPKRNAKQLYKTLLDFEEDSEDTEDEEDKTFEGPNGKFGNILIFILFIKIHIIETFH